jgi:transcriptional regulator with XRE-family HTH domain
MAESAPNVIRPRARPTQAAYRQRCADVVRRLKLEHNLTNEELGDRLGCSDETISNVENMRTNLNPVTLLNIDFEFGAGTIDPIRELSGTRGVPVGAVCDTDALPALTASVHSIAQARAPNSPGGPRITHGELAAMQPVLRQAIQALNWMLDRAENGEAA